MPLSERELARRGADGIELRAVPLRLRFRFDDLPCADAHLLRACFGCSIQALDQPIERQALEESFLSDAASVTSEQLIAHFQPALLAALSKLTGQRTAEQWLEEGAQASLLEAL